MLFRVLSDRGHLDVLVERYQLEAALLVHRGQLDVSARRATRVYADRSARVDRALPVREAQAGLLTAAREVNRTFDFASLWRFALQRLFGSRLRRRRNLCNHQRRGKISDTRLLIFFPLRTRPPRTRPLAARALPVAEALNYVLQLYAAYIEVLWSRLVNDVHRTHVGGHIRGLRRGRPHKQLRIGALGLFHGQLDGILGAMRRHKLGLVLRHSGHIAAD